MSLTTADIDRIIQMAWEDRTAFDALTRKDPKPVIGSIRDYGGLMSLL